MGIRTLLSCKIEQGVGVVEEDVGVENVILHVLRIVRAWRMPAGDAICRICRSVGGQLVMAGIEKIVEHAQQIEIHEARAFTEQERPMA